MSGVRTSRVLTALLSTAVVLLPLSPAGAPVTTTAAAAEPQPVTAVTLFDRTAPNPSYSSSRGSGNAHATPGGGVLTYQDTVSIEPAAGGRLVPGRISLTKGGAADEPRVRLGSFCATTYDAFVGGYLDVREATYADDGTLTSLAADVSLDCDWTVQTAQVRLASTVPYASVAADGDYATVYPGDTGTVTTTFKNDGTETFTPGVPYLTGALNGTGAADPAASISGDTCSGTPLAPGDSCAVTVTTPYGVTVQLPIPALDDLVARPGMRPAAARAAGVSVATRPTPVGSATATPAVDGVNVRWVPPPGVNQSYRVERIAPDGTPTVVGRDVSGQLLADTGAPTDQPSTYRVSPIGQAGPDVTGSKTTAAAMPYQWTAPADARTYVSVDGSAPAGAADVSATASNVTSNRTADRPALSIGMHGGWQLGRHEVGDADGQVGGSWSDNRQTSLGIVSGTLTVTRLAMRADGSPVELTASFSGTRRLLEGGTTPVSALIVVGSVPAGLPGYLTAEVPSQSTVPAATVTPGTLHTKVTVGTVADFAVTLTNIGGAAATPTPPRTGSILISPARGSGWSGTSACIGQSLAPGQTCTAAVRYDETSKQYPYGRTTWALANGQEAHVDLFADWQDRQSLPTVAVQPSSTVVQRDVTATVTGSEPGGQQVRLMCRVDVEPLIDCPSPWTVTGLSDGVHTLRAVAVTADGRMSDWAAQTFRADSTGPVTSLTQPTAGFGVVTSSRVHLAWDASDAGFGVVGGQAQRRTAGPTTGWSATAVASCCVGLSGRSVDVPATSGLEQCWSVRSVDGAGQYGAWTGERCFLAPLDDRRLAARGFTRARTTSAYLGTRSVARKKGATLTLGKVHARQIGLLVSTCPTCGSAQVLLGGRSIGNVRTAASRAGNRVVLWLPRLSSERSGTLTVRTTSAKSVVVDGLLVHHL